MFFIELDDQNDKNVDIALKKYRLSLNLKVWDPIPKEFNEKDFSKIE